MNKVMMATVAVVAWAATAHAAECLKVDDDNTRMATLAGRVVQHHKVVGYDFRTADTISISG
jgi:hypothetical protein